MIQVMTGKAGEANRLLSTLERGRHDHQYFSFVVLKRTLHDGQLEYVQNANATINALATANRYGKTTVLLNVHAHACTYKTGGEPRYWNLDGTTDPEKWLQLRYFTVHTADLSETAGLIYEEAEKIRGESPIFNALIAESPKSPYPRIRFVNGALWKFRTLGDDASGIDGHSFYVISIDEAGWITDLEEKMANVIRVRVADVRGRIHIVGTFKPGISRDFYKFCVRAGAYTGRGLTFDHRADDEVHDSADLDASIRSYLREFFRKQKAEGKTLSDDLLSDLARIGVTADELADVTGR